MWLKCDRVGSLENKNVGNFEIVKHYTEGLTERKTMENYIVS